MKLFACFRLLEPTIADDHADFHVQQKIHIEMQGERIKKVAR